MRETVKSKGIIIGLIYFYIHFVIEVVCFYLLNELFKTPALSWIVAFVYDALAFVPQSIIGYINDKNRRLNLCPVAFILLSISLLIYRFASSKTFLILIILCIGNCCGHIAGAEKTLRLSYGKMTPSSLFVAGGSFGVVIGKILSQMDTPVYLVILLIVLTIPFLLYESGFESNEECVNFDFCNKSVSNITIIMIAFFVVISRSYLGYGIPTSWKKTLVEEVLFYFCMGIGKALGGILIDTIGIRKTSVISMLVSIPLLVFGDNLMLISIIGVMFFSMTMSITLGVLVSILKQTPGLAFGITTIGLFFGSAPLFFFRIVNTTINIILIVCISLLSIFLSLYIVKDRNDSNI